MIRIMEQANTDMMLFGHTHKPYHRILISVDTDGSDHFRHAINIGLPANADSSQLSSFIK